MRYHRLDLNLLFALKVLLAEKSVTRAAESVCVTQSAMSGILARLREYFEDPLIVQVGRRMELTPLAEGLVDPVSDLLVRIDATVSARPEFVPATSRRHFSLVASDCVASVFLLDVLASVRRDAPGISFEIRPPSDATATELDMGDVDFIIHPEGLKSKIQSGATLFKDTYVLAVDKNNRDVGDTMSLDQYVSMGHVSMQSVQSSMPIFETRFNKQHGTIRRIEVTVPSFHLLPRLVVNTGLVATLHSRFAKQFVQSLPIKIVKPLFEISPLVEVLQWHSYRDEELGSVWLRNRIIDAAQALPPLETLFS
jgi:LysR family transcriptional regulator, nod-box dependent transcriptional activator